MDKKLVIIRNSKIYMLNKEPWGFRGLNEQDDNDLNHVVTLEIKVTRLHIWGASLFQVTGRCLTHNLFIFKLYNLNVFVCCFNVWYLWNEIRKGKKSKDENDLDKQLKLLD